MSHPVTAHRCGASSPALRQGSAGAVDPAWLEADLPSRLTGGPAGGHGDGVAYAAVDHLPRTAELVAALALAIGAFARVTRPLVHVADDGSALIRVDLDPAGGVAALVDSVERTLRGPAGQCTQDDYDALCARTGAGVLAGVFTSPVEGVPFPLSLSAHAGPQGARLELRHWLEELNPADAQDFLAVVATLTGQLRGSDPLARVDGLTLGPPAPVQGSAEPPGSGPGHLDQAWRRQVAQNPEAVAVTCAGTELTYAGLDERAGRLAEGLRRLGVAAGDRVGICLERSIDLVATMVAVIRLNAVYVPMDPSYPPDRLALIIEDAGLRVVVSDLPGLPVPPTAAVVSAAELAEASGPVAPPAGGTGADPAYVIYTSGSTGRPKGVVIAHRSVVALIDALRPFLAPAAGDRWSLFHSSAFDFSVWEIWGCLLTGGRLVVVPYTQSRDPEEFWELLLRERVTVLNQTPSAFAQLMAVDQQRPEPLAVRLVILGGEQFDARTAAAWCERYAAARLVNMYGITETTVFITAKEITQREVTEGTLSVGDPIPGWTVSVHDPLGRPLPFGVPGEIYVGGVGVGEEYLGRPELTAQRFVTDSGGERRYRSGDLGRLRRDGELEHLGRIDSQVKIRGYRVELGEIRAVLLADPLVADVAVVLGDAGPAGVRLEAYVVAMGDVVPSEAELAGIRERAAKALPSFMVPATITVMPALPLTPNGKLDERRLRQAEASPAAPAGTGPLETLREVWARVLGTAVGDDDDFFALGGDSLSAVRLVAAMREQGLPPVRVRQIYQTPTIAGLAAALGQST